MDKFNEYQFLYGRAEKLSERRQTTSQIYLTINTALFGAVAFMIKDSGMQGWKLAWGILPLFAFGILICIVWLNIILKLEKLLAWQYGKLREMEQQFPPDKQIFTEENRAFFAAGKGRKKFSFSLLEAWLPGILMSVYGVYGIGILIGVLLGWL